MTRFNNKLSYALFNLCKALYMEHCELAKKKFYQIY